MKVVLDASVASTSPLEIASVIARCEERRLLQVSRSEAFVAAIEAAPFAVECARGRGGERAREGGASEVCLHQQLSIYLTLVGKRRA